MWTSPTWTLINPRCVYHLCHETIPISSFIDLQHQKYEQINAHVELFLIKYIHLSMFVCVNYTCMDCTYWLIKRLTIFFVGRPAPWPALHSMRPMIGLVCGLFSKLLHSTYCMVCQISKTKMSWSIIIKEQHQSLRLVKTLVKDEYLQPATSASVVAQLGHRDLLLITWWVGIEWTYPYALPTASSHYAVGNTWNSEIIHFYHWGLLFKII